MAVWKLQRLGLASFRTGEPFPPDTEIVTALFGEEDEAGEDRVRGSGFLRKDFLVHEADEAALLGAFCVWRTRTPPVQERGPRRFDLGLAREFLERLLEEGRPDRGPVCLTLALLLARKRRLVILDQETDVLQVRWPREQRVFPVPAPLVTEAEAESLQQELMRLFETQGAAGAAEAPEPGLPAAQAPAAASSEPVAPGGASPGAAGGPPAGPA